MSPDGTKLYPLLEGALSDDSLRTRLLLQEFDIATKRYSGRYWFYPLSDPGHAIGDMTAINDHEFLVIERDNGQGQEARFKWVYRVDLRQVADDGMLVKQPVAGLMAISDPRGVSVPEAGAVGLGAAFSFPFVTIESVFPVDQRTLLVINDNNYPFSSGRRPGSAPDDSEFILLRLPAPLDLDQPGRFAP